MQYDYQDSEMAQMAVAPDTTTPRVFGILNIIFSLLGACGSAYILVMAVLMPVMAKTMETATKAMEEASVAEIEALEEEEAAATTEEEKASIRTEIDALKTRPNANAANPLAAMNDPVVSLHGTVDGSTGLFFNLLLFISGVGLLVRKEWARKLAIWTAVLKIIRLICLESVYMSIIIPIKMKQMHTMYEQIEMGGQGVATAEIAGMQGVAFTAFSVAMLVVGCIYPALSLWFLSRPGVKVTCQQDAETTSEE